LSTRVKHLATLSTECSTRAPRPLVALDRLDSWTGKLLQGTDLKPRDPGNGAGIASVEPGDLLFGKLRPYLAKTWVADRAVYASTELLCLRPGPDVDSRWLGYLMLSRGVVEWAVATSDGTKMPRTSWERLGAYRVQVPGLAKQRAIADFLDTETARIDALIAKKRELTGRLHERDSGTIDRLCGQGVPFVRLGYIAVVQSGITVDARRPRSADDVTLPYLRVANVQPGRLDLDEVSEITVPRSVAKRSTLQTGDVLMTEGGDLDKLGRGTVWSGEIVDCLHQNHVFAVRPKAGVLDSSYLALLTRASHARAYFERTGTRTTNLASTNASKVADFRVPLPPLDEQRRIVVEYAAWALTLEALTVRLIEQIELLAEHRQALITAAVTGELDVARGIAAEAS
jgi:type I restriction enzyme, S subunit